MAGEFPPSGQTPPDQPPAPKKAAIRIFQCPSCGATLEIKAVGQTITVGCRACGSTLDTSREDVQLVEKGQLLKRQIYIPIGTRGTFDGVVYETIGIMGRVDKASGYGWKEYLLYNPYQGFRWLSEAGAQWNYVTPLKESPRVDDSVNFKTGLKPRAILGGRIYTHFQTSDAEVDFVLGEFYWRVKKGDRSSLEDYVDPPELLSCEKNGSERIWSRCTYMTPEAVQAAFKMPAKLPYALGVAPNQPNPHLKNWHTLRGVWFVFTAVIVCLYIFHRANTPNRIVFSQSLRFEPTNAEKIQKLGPFELTGTGNLQVELNASIDNAYLDVDVDLVNETTGESRDMQVGAEYWSGYDSDGSWSEGSTHSADLETGVGSGTYHLNITPTSGSGTGRPRLVDYSLFVTRGVPVGSNLFLAWLLLSVIPIWFAFRSTAFESERWSGSDYATSGGDGDDE